MCPVQSVTYVPGPYPPDPTKGRCPLEPVLWFGCGQRRHPSRNQTKKWSPEAAASGGGPGGKAPWRVSGMPPGSTRWAEP